jgi:hypothetical protein
LHAVTLDRAATRRLAPGLAVAAAGALAAVALHAWADALNALTAAVLLGVVIRALHPLPGWAQAGTAFARKKLLQAGIVLLGLELSVGQLLELGAPTLVLVVVTVALTFVATLWFGRLMGLPPAMSLFIATGFSICGVSALWGLRRPGHGGRRVERTPPARVPRRVRDGLVGAPRGGAVQPRRLARPALAGVTGRRAAAVGLASWVLVEGTSLVGLHLVT